MAAMCPIEGCKAKKGLCIHDKLMIDVPNSRLSLR